MARAAVAWETGVRVRRRNWIAAVLAVLFVVVTPSVVAWLIWRGLPTPKDVSVFAEAFGNIVGPLFAAYTALMQREELSLQRQELRETRGELKRTADAQEASQKALQAQEKALQAQVDTAKLAARLNAAVAIVEHYDKLAVNLPPDDTRPKEGEERYNILEGRKDMQNELFRVRNELVGPVQAVGVATGGAGTASGTGEAGGPKA